MVRDLTQFQRMKLSEALNHLEEACHAAFTMKAKGLLSDAEYERINEMIWTCENILKGDE